MVRMGFQPVTSGLKDQSFTDWANQCLVGGGPYTAIFFHMGVSRQKPQSFYHYSITYKQHIFNFILDFHIICHPDGFLYYYE